MDRGSSKHGPHLDDQMAHETQDVVHSGHSTHTEEWRQTEPDDEAWQSRPLPPGPPDGPTDEDIELRSALARAVSRSEFPADRGRLLRRVQEAGAPQALIDRVAALPEGRHYANVGEASRALGLEPEDGRW